MTSVLGGVAICRALAGAFGHWWQSFENELHDLTTLSCINWPSYTGSLSVNSECRSHLPVEQVSLAYWQISHGWGVPTQDNTGYSLTQPELSDWYRSYPSDSLTMSGLTQWCWGTHQTRELYSWWDRPTSRFRSSWIMCLFQKNRSST